MGLGISMETVWNAYDEATSFVGGIRTHVNAGIAKTTASIETQANKIFDNYYAKGIEKVPKEQVEILIDKTKGRFRHTHFASNWMLNLN